MSDLNSVDNRKSNHRNNQSIFIIAPIIIVLVIAVVWLYIEVGRIHIPTEAMGIITLSTSVEYNTSNISLLSRDISSLDSKLSYVARIAENANFYAHSHTYSDERLKQDIFPLSNALSSILQLQGVSFYWEENLAHQLNLPSTSQVGFIAQEVEQIYPELIAIDSMSYKSIDYSKFSPILVEAIKEQQTQIDDLRRENQQLEDRLIELEKLAQDDGKP